jgi:hypothetical protein
VLTLSGSYLDFPEGPMSAQRLAEPVGCSVRRYQSGHDGVGRGESALNPPVVPQAPRQRYGCTGHLRVPASLSGGGDQPRATRSHIRTGSTPWRAHWSRAGGVSGRGPLSGSRRGKCSTTAQARSGAPFKIDDVTETTLGIARTGTYRAPFGGKVFERQLGSREVQSVTRAGTIPGHCSRG